MWTDGIGRRTNGRGEREEMRECKKEGGVRKGMRKAEIGRASCRERV